MSRFGLEPTKIASLPLTPDGKKRMHSDGRGLSVICEPTKKGITRSYNFHFTWVGQKVIKRMGDISEMSLRAARDKATKYRLGLKDGIDPRRVADGPLGQETFLQYWDKIKADLIHTRAHEWQYAIDLMAPLHDRPIGAISLDEVNDTIKGYWKAHPVSASRYLMKIFAVFDHARVRKLRPDNPALLADLYALRAIKPPRELAPVVPHPALPHADLPAFMTKLRYETSMTARCLEFCILTASRSQEARLAQWSWLNADMTEITMPGDVTKNGTVIKKGVMKAGVKHTIPLPTQVTEMLRKLPRTCDLIFPTAYGFDRDKAMYPLALIELANRLHLGNTRIKVHGFRSTFRDWALVNKKEERWVLEMCIAHETRSATEKAYARDEAVDRRRPVMQAFADYALSAAPKVKVVPLRAA